MTHSMLRPISVPGFLALLLLSACVTMPPGLGGKQITAGAALAPVSSAFVRGLVKFTDDGKGMTVVSSFSGLLPGDYTLYLHDASETCTKVAVHRPDNVKSGDQKSLGGPLLGLTADVYGTAKSETLLSGLTLEGKDSILGRTVVLYAIAPDGRPYRMACGQIAPITSPTGQPQ